MTMIEPNLSSTGAAGPGLGGLGVGLMIGMMALGLATSGWIDALDRDSDDDFVQIEDERGPLSTIDVELAPSDAVDAVDEGPVFGFRFDDREANSADEEAADEEGLDEQEAAEVVPLGPIGIDPERFAGVTACVFHDITSARSAWQRLPDADRPLLQRFCRSHGVDLP